MDVSPVVAPVRRARITAALNELVARRPLTLGDCRFQLREAGVEIDLPALGATSLSQLVSRLSESPDARFTLRPRSNKPGDIGLFALDGASPRVCLSVVWSCYPRVSAQV